MADAPNYPTLPEGAKARFKCEDCDGNGYTGEMHGGSEFQPPEPERCSSCEGAGWWSEGDAFSPAHMRAYVDADRAARATPSPPVALPQLEQDLAEFWKSVDDGSVFNLSPELRRLVDVVAAKQAPPVAAPPATPVATEQCRICGEGPATLLVMRNCAACGCDYAGEAETRIAREQPQPQPAQPLTGADHGGMTIVKALRMGLRAEVWLDGGAGPKACVGICAIQLQGWTHTADTAKAWADAYNRAIDNMRAAYALTAPSTPTQPEVAP